MVLGDLEFRRVAEAFSSLERITARTQLTLVLVKLFKDTPADVIDKVVYLIQGKLGPDWKGIPELGVGEKYLVKAIASAYRVSEDSVVRLFKSVGDLGEVAEKLSRQGRGVGLADFMAGGRRRLTVSRVFDTLLKIAYAG